jgi:hypothetical protein
MFITFNQPANFYVTVYRVSITEVGGQQGWTVDKLADEVLRFADLTLETCPRDETLGKTTRDPFKKPSRDQAG